MRKILAGTFLLIALAGVGAYWVYFRPPTGEAPAELPVGITASDYSDAEAWFAREYPQAPLTREAIMLVLGDRASESGKIETAVNCYRQIGTQTPMLGLTARLEEGKLLVQLNLADQAENALLQFLVAARTAPQLKPEQVLDAFKWLTYILSVEIRQEDRRAVLIEQTQIGLADPLDSKQLFFPNLLILNSPAGRKKIAEFLLADPENVKLKSAKARYSTLEGDFENAVASLESLSKSHPTDLTIAAALAEAYFESADSPKLSQLIDELPAWQDQEPWLLTRMRGESALESKSWEVAVDFFKKVLLFDPANAPAQMGLVKAYKELGEVDLHRQALERSSILAKIRVNLSTVQPDAVAACNDLAESCSAIGMDQAAEVFRFHARSIAGSADSANTSTKD